jgi:hypothetical protein
MHSIYISEVSGEYQTRGWRDDVVTLAGVIGVKAVITPPVGLTQQAVEHFLGGRQRGLQNPMLLGNTEAATVIYDPLPTGGDQAPANHKEALAAATQNLLRVMGVEAQIVTQ